MSDVRSLSGTPVAGDFAASSGTPIVVDTTAGDEAAYILNASSRIVNLAFPVVNVKNFGAAGNGTTDDTSAINNALAAASRVYFPSGTYKITSNVIMPAGTMIEGESRYSTKIVLSGNIDGLTMRNSCEVRDIRIIGNTSMTTDSDGRNRACLLLGTPSVDCYDSKVSDVILGGYSTRVLDASSSRVNGAGLKYGLSYSNKLSRVLALQCDLGIEGSYVSGVTMNATVLEQCEVQSNVIGGKMASLFGVTLDTFAAQGNDKEGLIIGGSRSSSIVQLYMEANNTQNTGAKRADLWVEGSVTAVGSADVGTYIEIKGGYWVAGANSLYGLFADKQGGIDINGPKLVGYGGATNAIYVGDTDTSGAMVEVYSNSAATFRFPTNFIVGNYEYSGLSQRGTYTPVVSNSKYGSTAALAPAGAANLYTPVAGSGWLLFATANTNNSGIRWSGIVEGHASSALTITPIASALITIDNNAGAVRLTNNHGASTLTFNWSALRVF